MSAEIFYFSGTGNSLAVARDIARKTDAKLIPVTSVIEQETIHIEADAIGIVFPLYDFKPPHMFGDFIKKLPDIGSKYLFAVGTFGLTPLKAMKKLKKDIKACGGTLSAGFVVHMPHSGLGHKTLAGVQQENMFKQWEEKRDLISEYVNARKQGPVETTNVFTHVILSGLLFKALPTLIPLLWRAMRHGWESLALVSDEKCNGCDICAKVCPVDNIEMVENRPSWSNHCAGCFACLHWCPEESIQVGSITANMERYHHPDVTIADIMRQSSNHQKGITYERHE